MTGHNAVKKRGGHRKSTNGCSACKRRHIKCDETGPPCANCTIRRGSVCIYLVKQDTTPIMTWTPPSRSRHNHSSADQVIQDLRKQQRNLRITAPLHPGPTIPPPSYFSSSSSSSSGGGSSVPATPAQRDLELELVHRWSVRTWRGLQMIPACSGFLRVVLPRDMLRHDFLLSATLALAAADVAVSSSSGGSRGGSRVYADAAAAYVALAGWQFHRAVEELRDRRRRGLNGGGLGKENLYIFAQFGDMMGYYYMALPGSEVTSCGSLTSGVVAGGGGEDVVMTATLAPVPARPSIISRVHMAMQMFTGSMKTASLNWAWYLDSPTSARQAYEDYSPRLDAMRLLDAETLEAIKLMSSVANAVRVEVADGLAVSYNEIRSYCFAIGQTKYEFAEQLLQRMSGSFLSVPGVSGTFDSGFLDGIAEREPVALFVLMFWGVAIWRARTDGLWWIRTTGRELVDETCGLLVGGGIWGLEDVRKGVEWCRKEVGLNQLWEESEGFDDVVASRTDNSKT